MRANSDMNTSDTATNAYRADFDIPAGQAARAGATAAATALLFLESLRWMGVIGLNFPILVGTIFYPQISDMSWVLGVALLVAGGAGTGLLYAQFFRWGHHINVGLGLILGLAQWMAGGFALWIIELVNPLVPTQLMPPGLFAVNHEPMTWGMFLVANFIYGAAVAALEKRRIKSSRAVPSDIEGHFDGTRERNVLSRTGAG